MILWLQANLGTILVSLVLLAIVGAIVGNMIQKKRAGKSNCSCGCENCAAHGQCHK